MKIAFLDRDGVINVNVGYLHSISEFKFTPGCIAALKRLCDLGYELVIITNQSGIARGYYSEAEYQELTDWMLAQLSAQQIPILEVLHCPHLPGGKVEKYAVHCDCRKPKPGMIERVVTRYPVDVAASLLVGDSITDIEAGDAMGIEQLFLVGEAQQTALDRASYNSVPRITGERSDSKPAFFRMKDLAAVSHYLSQQTQIC